MTREFVDSREAFDIHPEALERVILVSWVSENVPMKREVYESILDGFLKELNDKGITDIECEHIDYQ
jgi:hypothetical protein